MALPEDTSLTEFWKEAQELQRTLDSLKEISEKNRRNASRLGVLVQELAKPLPPVAETDAFLPEAIKNGE